MEIVDSAFSLHFSFRIVQDLEETAGVGLIPKSVLEKRYELESSSLTAEEYLQAWASYRYQGNIERTARQLLNDFRKGLLGAIPLELPPI